MHKNILSVETSKFTKKKNIFLNETPQFPERTFLLIKSRNFEKNIFLDETSNSPNDDQKTISLWGNIEISEKTTFLWIKLQVFLNEVKNTFFRMKLKNSLRWNLEFSKKIFLSIKSWTFSSYQISKFPNWDQKTFYETSNFRKKHISLNKSSKFSKQKQHFFE